MDEYLKNLTKLPWASIPELVFFSTCLTVSRELESVNSSFTAWPASNRKVQRVCPSGGALQATATRWASCFPSSLRRCPGRGRSLRALSNPPSTKRSRTRPTVAGPTIRASATCRSVRPSSALHKIKARFTLRPEDWPRRVIPNKCSRSSWVKFTRYNLAGIPHTPHYERMPQLYPSLYLSKIAGRGTSLAGSAVRSSCLLQD